METKKRGLCAFDDKRYMLTDGVSTLAFGHHEIPTIIEDDESPEMNVSVYISKLFILFITSIFFENFK